MTFWDWSESPPLRGQRRRPRCSSLAATRLVKIQWYSTLKRAVGCDELRQEGFGCNECKCYLSAAAAPVSMSVPVNEAVDTLLGRMHEMLPDEGRAPLGDFSLKIRGKSEFLHLGSGARIGDYAFVHTAAFSEREICLVLRKNPLEQERDALEHEALQELGRDAPLHPDERQPNQEAECASLWDVRTQFRINILEYVQTQSTESTKSAEPESSHSHEGKAKPSKLEKLLSRGASGVKLYVTASVCFGGEILANLEKQTASTPWNSNARWAEKLEFPIAMCDLPREARACFTVWAADYSYQGTRGMGFSYADGLPWLRACWGCPSEALAQ